jgi:integrase
LHNLPLDKISRKDVAARLTRISLESGSIVAARARAQLSALFGWALAHGLCEANPVVGTLAPKNGQPRERVLSDAELSRIWKACGDDDHGRCTKLLILTGCRRQEIGGMCWSEIDFDRGTWTLPAARSKNGRAHTLPMLPAMRMIAS